MALARVVTFEDVDADELARQAAEMESGDRPDDLPASEIIVLHDQDARKSIVVLFFGSEEDYAAGDAVLDAMDASETPGRRTSVGKYSVAMRATA
jgi:hypothetical protein